MSAFFLSFAFLLAPAAGVSGQVEKKPLNTSYRFDALQRLRGIQETLGPARWIARDLSGLAQVETTTYLVGGTASSAVHRHDGWRRIEMQGAAGESKRFLYGHALDELLVQESSGAQLAPVVSQLGSTMISLGGTGAIVDQFRYDAFGAPLAGNTKAFAHLFAGAIYDHKSKLYDLRHRHYDPKTGRFLSRDPLGMHADGFNTGNAYAYVGNNPLNRRDPLGLLTGEGNEDPGFWSLWWKFQKQAFADTGKGLWNSAVGTWEAGKFVVTEEIPNLVVDAGIAVGAIDNIPYQSATVQTAQSYYAQAGNDAWGAACNLGKDVASGAWSTVKDYGVAVWNGDCEAASETFGYALQGLGATKGLRTLKKLKGSLSAKPSTGIPKAAGEAMTLGDDAAGSSLTVRTIEGPSTGKCATPEKALPAPVFLHDQIPGPLEIRRELMDRARENIEQAQFRVTLHKREYPSKEALLRRSFDRQIHERTLDHIAYKGIMHLMGFEEVSIEELEGFVKKTEQLLKEVRKATQRGWLH